MADMRLFEAACCLAGMDHDVTVEELQLLGDLAGHAGLDRKHLNALIERTREDEDFREDQIDRAMHDAGATMSSLIEAARRDGALDRGHVMMLLWRVGDRLQLGADRFQELLAAE